MATPAHAATIGRMHDFNPENESISAYLERFELFVTVNGIAAEKRAPTLLLVLGMNQYSLIRGMVSPQKPEEKSYDELVALLKKHFDPEPIVIAERFQYYQRTQGSGESVSEYLANLRKLAARCQFGTFLSEALRDRLVCGLNSESIQKALLAKPDLTLESALEIAISMEAAAKKAKEMKGQGNGTVLKVTKHGDSSAPARNCDRCGRGKHSRDQCKFKGATCHKCGKVGHISPVCRSKAKSVKTGSKQSAKWLTSDSASDTCAEEPLFAMSDHSSCPAYNVELQLNDHPVVMEIDTGAGVSIAPESQIADLLPTLNLQTTHIRLRTYTGEHIPVKGIAQVDVTYGERQYTNLELLVVQGDGPCLLGRDWLGKIPLDWRKIGRVIAEDGTPQGRLACWISTRKCSRAVWAPSHPTWHLYMSKKARNPSSTRHVLVPMHRRSVWAKNWIGWRTWVCWRKHLSVSGQHLSL